MARQASDEELHLKKRARRRLVGAIALVLLIVVFLPMVLDGEPNPTSRDIKVDIPPVAPVDSAHAPPAVSPPSTSAKPTAPAMPSEGSAAPPSAAPPQTQPQQEPPPASRPPAPAAESAPRTRDAASPAARPVPPPKVAAAPAAGEGFVLQMGAFSDPANAKQLAARLRANKIPVYTEVVKTAEGARTRVRAGPFATQAAAEQARTRIKTLHLAVAGEPKIVRQGE